MKVKVREITRGCRFGYNPKGECIDLRAAEDVHFNAPQAGTLKRKTTDGVEESHRDVTFDFKLIPLGIAMQLPKGYEAHILPRSSTYKNFGIIQANGEGIIDNTYCGNNDEWKFPAIALRETTIHKGDRICQFKIELSQKATIWQKIKWLFTSKIEFEQVDELSEDDRGGIGSTGTN